MSWFNNLHGENRELLMYEEISFIFPAKFSINWGIRPLADKL